MSLRITENQEKVIRDKYLRDDPNVETWLKRIAHNIALAEILHMKIEGDPYKGVDHKKDKKLGMLLHVHPEVSERNANFNRFIENLENIYNSEPEAKAAVNKAEEKFYKLMSSWDFLPNSPTLMNAGRELQQLSACYVVDVGDSMESIMKAVSATALITKSGGGVGYSFGDLRTKGSPVKQTRGVASGAVSFMSIFDKMVDVVKQGGLRRGALMGILPYHHPEIFDFITAKEKQGNLENFNISVAIDAEFMQAVEENTDVSIRDPRTHKITSRVPATKIWKAIVDSAWRTGDPGLVVLDRINNSGSNTTPALGLIKSTNPCGEQALLPWEPCNLGSINLSNFVKNEKVDWGGLKEVVGITTWFLDNVIDMNNYPIPEIEEMSKGNRRIGLGVMGWAEMLIKLGIPYDSEEALKHARDLMKFINDNSLKASESLADVRGTFPNWKDSAYDRSSKHFRGAEYKPRNCARTTAAPTGTIAIAAGLQGGGIEPFFAIAYTRYNAKALEALKNKKTPNPNDVFVEVNPLFKKIAEDHDYFGLSESELWDKINTNHKAARGVKEIPQEIQDLFPTSHDVNVSSHIKMQAAFQEYIDGGISKTVNMPNSATREDISQAYKLAYKLGCKGVTIYRDGSKSQQVLNLNSKPSKMKKKKKGDINGVNSQYYKVETGYGPLHVHINYDETGPTQVFANLPPLGTEIAGLTTLTGILLSKYLEEGGDPINVLKHLNSVKGDKPHGFGPNKINSIPHALSKVMHEHLKKTGYIKGEEKEGKLTSALTEIGKEEHCSKCYSTNVAYESGCSEPSCKDCGYSKCS